MKKNYFLSILLLIILTQNIGAQTNNPTLELATFLKAKKKVKDAIITVFDKDGKKVELKTGTTEAGRVLLYFPFFAYINSLTFSYLNQIIFMNNFFSTRIS